MHLPVLQESVLEEMNEEHYDPKQDQVDPMLLKLPAAHLKGTFAKAYKILTEITSQIGWDTLLKCRSSVFVMEEEYREEKKNSSVATLRGTPRQSEDRPPQNGDDSNGDQPTMNGGDKTEDGQSESVSIEKPENSVPPEPKEGEETELDDGKLPAEKYTHFQNKRLCERWLDNLFMVLYEVLGRSQSVVERMLTHHGGPSCVHYLAFRIRTVQAAVAPIQEECV
jgi:hypothetical protein